MRIPLIRLDRVLHIGTLDPADRGRNVGAYSQEGDFLSVSLCPLAWRRIVKLGGYPLHELTCRDGLFVDMRAVLADPDLVAAISDWARAEGLVEEREAWQAWRWDDESDAWRYTAHGSEAKARHELGYGMEDFSPEDIDEPDDGPAVRPVTVFGATPALRAAMGEFCGEFDDATEPAVRCWSQRVAPLLLDRPLDGVWWREEYNPYAYSAPRGAIFPERLPAWAARPLPWSAADDEAELATMPDTTWEALPAPAPAP